MVDTRFAPSPHRFAVEHDYAELTLGASAESTPSREVAGENENRIEGHVFI